MELAEIRSSLLVVGPLLPQLIWAGRVVDGEKRDALCTELGILFPQRRLATREEACAALWLVHPERALVVAETDRVLELARLCSARPVDIARVLAGQRPAPPKVRRSPRQTQGQKNVLVQVWIDPQLKHYLTAAKTDFGKDASSLIREATWSALQRLYPRAATEGARRGPSPELVRPRRR